MLLCKLEKMLALLKYSFEIDNNNFVLFVQQQCLCCVCMCLCRRSWRIFGNLELKIYSLMSWKKHAKINLIRLQPAPPPRLRSPPKVSHATLVVCLSPLPDERIVLTRCGLLVERCVGRWFEAVVGRHCVGRGRRCAPARSRFCRRHWCSKATRGDASRRLLSSRRIFEKLHHCRVCFVFCLLFFKKLTFVSYFQRYETKENNDDDAEDEAWKNLMRERQEQERV